MKDTVIVPYEPGFKNDFVTLNTAWLEEYFYVEEHDLEILNSCQEYILDKGGYIFMALQKKEVVGCYALLKIEEGVFELGKMAVREDQRGKHIGQGLMEHCITLARSKGWNKLILYSSVKLLNALHIYRKYGFREITLEKSSPYKRSSIKMELIFDKNS